MLLFGKGTALACTNRIFFSPPLWQPELFYLFSGSQASAYGQAPSPYLQDTNKLKIHMSVGYCVYLPLTQFIVEALGLYLKRVSCPDSVTTASSTSVD